VDIVAGLLQGFSVALAPSNLLWCFVGVFLGTVVGVLPGLGPPRPSRCCCRSLSA